MVEIAHAKVAKPRRGSGQVRGRYGAGTGQAPTRVGVETRSRMDVVVGPMGSVGR